MKKSVITATVGALVLSAMGIAFASSTNVVSSTVFVPGNTGGYSEMVTPSGEEAKAIAFKSLEQFDSNGWISNTCGHLVGSCNQEDWNIYIKTNVHMSQWINWDIDFTQWDFLIRKPGIYATDCIELRIASNYDVMLSKSGFGDLVGANGTVPAAWTMLGASVVPSSADFATAFNGSELLSYDLVKKPSGTEYGWSKKLWSKVEISDTLKPGFYSDMGLITISATLMQPWIEAATGNYTAAALNPPSNIFGTLDTP